MRARARAHRGLHNGTRSIHARRTFHTLKATSCNRASGIDGLSREGPPCLGNLHGRSLMIPPPREREREREREGERGRERASYARARPRVCVLHQVFSSIFSESRVVFY
jgi:hypothetical protein